MIRRCFVLISMLQITVIAAGCQRPAETGPGTPPENATPAIPAANESSLEVTTNSLGMTFVLIPAGKFTMGATGAEPLKRMVTPAHPVRITKPFYLGRTEVTKGQFAKFVAATGYKTDAEREGEGGSSARDPFMCEPPSSWRSWGAAEGDHYPVVNVSWNDAVAFCKWLSEQEHRNYSLPTEAEWEYACRAGTQTAFSYGDDKYAIADVGNVVDQTFRDRRGPYHTLLDAARGHDGYVHTAPVAQFPPNAFGLYDMHGNVEEWCADWDDTDYYGKSPEADPVGPTTGQLRVCRGGSWVCDVGNCSSAYRSATVPDDVGCYLGFRVRLEPQAKP